MLFSIVDDPVISASDLNHDLDTISAADPEKKLTVDNLKF